MILEVVADRLADGLEIVFAQRLVGDRFQHQDAGIAVERDVDAGAIDLANPVLGTLIVAAAEVPQFAGREHPEQSDGVLHPLDVADDRHARPVADPAEAQSQVLPHRAGLHAFPFAFDAAQQVELVVVFQLLVDQRDELLLVILRAQLVVDPDADHVAWKSLDDGQHDAVPPLWRWMSRIVRERRLPSSSLSDLRRSRPRSGWRVRRPDVATARPRRWSGWSGIL